MDPIIRYTWFFCFYWVHTFNCDKQTSIDNNMNSVCTVWTVSQSNLVGSDNLTYILCILQETTCICIYVIIILSYRLMPINHKQQIKVLSQMSNLAIKLFVLCYVPVFSVVPIWMHCWHFSCDTQQMMTWTNILFDQIHDDLWHAHWLLQHRNNLSWTTISKLEL